ncbi:MAG: hypothetical protein NZ750_12215 [Anaerolineae bacterium]|nr:hypothetical protein [Anaerolineae bacterium]MDW8172120.1 hypothetical protein [Anaerolineae bacterium]
MLRSVVASLILLLGSSMSLAQDAINDLVVEGDLKLIQFTDSFGLEARSLRGTLRNAGTRAYGDVTLMGEGFDANNRAVAEVFGYLVDACGSALVDLALQPNESRPFALKVDQYAEGEPVRWELSLSGQAQDAALAPPPLPAGLRRFSPHEVVAVEWASDSASFLYGMGCSGDIFTAHEWANYDVQTGRTQALEAHPNAAQVTKAMIARAGITQITQTGGGENPQLLESSFLTMPSFSTRAIFQTDLHDLYTTERDGRFRRLVQTGLYQHSLQGFVWSSANNFVAIYFGGFGEDVRYFTASDQGGALSPHLLNNPPSRTIPGLTDDGRAVIIGGTLDEQTGYILRDFTRGRSTLLYRAYLPSNNYPAPQFRRVDDGVRLLYVIRPSSADGPTILECFTLGSSAPIALTELPFMSLREDERAWAWLSPNGAWLALGRSGAQGGGWLIDLAALGAHNTCPASDGG